jgi:16S rRNA (guanine966-N2)-methyltransferase
VPGKNKINRVRIIGGAWRSRRIEFPDAQGLRPTPDRVRETLFNWLGQALDGKSCLDLFAGSGALGFEALSRGARHVTLVEKNKPVADALRRAAGKLEAVNLTIVCADALDYLAQCRAQFDLVFLDPPYRQGWLPIVLPKVRPCVVPHGCVYVECEQEWNPGPDWETCRQGRAGEVHYYLLQPVHEEAPC